MTEQIFNQIESELKDSDYRVEFGRETAKLDFALALIRARTSEGLTQSELAAKLGVKQPYVARLESGDANPTIGNAGSILAVLWAKPSWDLTPLVQVSAVDDSHKPPPSVPITGEELEELMGRWALVADENDDVQRQVVRSYEGFSGSERDFASAA